MKKLLLEFKNRNFSKSGEFIPVFVPYFALQWNFTFHYTFISCEMWKYELSHFTINYHLLSVFMCLNPTFKIKKR